MQCYSRLDHWCKKGDLFSESFLVVVAFSFEKVSSLAFLAGFPVKV